MGVQISSEGCTVSACNGARRARFEANELRAIDYRSFHGSNDELPLMIFNSAELAENRCRERGWRQLNRGPK